MKKLKIISILTILYAFSHLQAQDRHIELDSLRSCLKTAKNDTVRVNLLNRMSYLVWNDGNKYDEALKYAVLAKSLSDSIDFKPGLAVSLRRIGIIYNGIGDYSKALDYLLHSLQINEYIKNNREIFLINGDIGLVYYNQKNLDDAIRFFLKSLQYNKNDGFTLQWIGTIYVAQGKYELGLKFLFLARNSYNNTKDISAVLNTIGTTFEQQGKIDSALSYYFKSLQISKNDLDQNCSDAYGGIGDIYFTQKSYKKSIEFELKSLYVARMIKYLYSVKETEKKLSQIYDSIGDCKKSFLHFRNYIMVRDSLFNDDAIKSTTRAEMNYQFDKKQMIENAIHDSEMKRQTMQRNGFICGFSLVLLFSLFIFRSYRKTKRQKNIISEQKKIVDEKNKDILDSIRYSLRIQNAILPPQNFVDEVLPEHLIYFTPKDIVSGDFYYIDKVNENIFWAACDATGHSSNGAMLSMLGLNILSGIIKDNENVPSKILDKLNERFNESLHKTGDDSIRDGMDISFCSLDLNTLTLNYAGANNPLWIIRNGDLIEYKADKMPIGQMYKTNKYTNHEIKVQNGDCIYSFSDGICDLHSEDNKKFLKKRLRELLLSIQNKSMSEQKEIISESLLKWKGNADQVDDMLLIGVRI